MEERDVAVMAVEELNMADVDNKEKLEVTTLGGGRRIDLSNPQSS